MPPQTTGLTDRTRRALKGVASRESRSLDSTAEKNSEPRSIPSDGNLRMIIAKARAKSGLNDDDAMSLAVEEVRRSREGR